MSDLVVSKLDKGIKTNSLCSPGEQRELVMMEPTPEIVLIIQKALESKRINADTFLIESITVLEREDQLVYPALALRYGANPNGYVNTLIHGKLHLMPHSYNSLTDTPDILSKEKRRIPFEHKDKFVDYDSIGSEKLLNKRKELLDQLMLLFMMAGAITGNKSMGGNNAPNEDVKKYFINQGFPDSIVTHSDWKEVAKTKWLTYNGILLNKPEYLIGHKLQQTTDQHYNDLINSLISISDKVTEIIVEPDYFPVNTVDIIIDYMSVKMLELYLEKGYSVDYNTFNNILVKMIEFKSGMSFDTYERMGMIAIKAGYDPSSQQLNQLKGLTPKTYEEIEKEKQKPIWIRECNSLKGEFSFGMKNVLFSLGITVDAKKVDICNQIKEIIKYEHQKIIEHNSIKLKDMVLLSHDMYPDGNVQNENDLDNPFDRTYLSVISYKDGESRLWCFTDDRFESLLINKVNPYTNEELSEMFLEQIRHKVKMIKKFSYGPTINYSTALNMLKGGRVFTEETKECPLGAFNGYLRMNNIDPNVLIMTPVTTRQQIFDELDIKVKLSILPLNLQYESFIKNLHTKLVDENYKSDMFEVIRRVI
jgi:hypothetical protein